MKEHYMNIVVEVVVVVVIVLAVVVILIVVIANLRCKDLHVAGCRLLPFSFFRTLQTQRALILLHLQLHAVAKSLCGFAAL